MPQMTASAASDRRGSDRPGSWRSFDAYGDGAVRCGAGTADLNALARLAYRRGCA